METPNLFQIATKELSQDGFFTWLIQWANKDYAKSDPTLNEIAKDFVRLLMNQSEDFKVGKVEAVRQWEHIDILAQVNDCHAIIIEDKTNTGEHSEQLERYKQTAEEWYIPKNYTLHYVYLKTGNESLSSLENIENKGYTVIDRKAILQVLNKRVVQNNILADFSEYLNSIEKETNSYNTIENLTNSWKASEGFFLKLQEELHDGDWRYVANASGGFLGFWYHWNETASFNIYIQIENYFGNVIKLVIKVSDSDEDVTTDMLYQALEEIQPFAKRHKLSIDKPNRYRAGTTSTLAIVNNAFPESGELNIQKFVGILHNLEKVIDEYYESKTNK